MITRIVSAIAIFALASLLLPFSAHAQDTGQSADLEQVTLQLIWKNQFQFAGYYVAKEKGFYRDAGLDVSIRPYEFGMNVTQDVLSRKADFGVGRSSLILEKLNGSEIFLLAAIYQHSPFILLTKQRPDLVSVGDLKDRKIMTTDDVVGMASLTAMLVANGVSEESYTKQEHSFDVDDLISGKTDALAGYISNEPYQMDKKGVPYRIFSPKDHGFDFYSDILFTAQQKYETNPDQVLRFYQASIKGWEYAFDNIEEVVGLIEEKYNSQNRSREALLFEANALKKMAYTPGVDFGDLNQSRIDQIAQVYRLLGLTQSTVELHDFYYQPENLSGDIQLGLTAEERQWLEKHPVIKVHNELNWAPFNFNQNGVAGGYSVDYMNLLAERIGVEVEYVSGEWGPLLQQVYDKELDVMLNIVKTPERMKHLLYTSSYIRNPNVIIAKEGSPYSDIQSLQGKRVTYPEGFFYDEILKEKFPDIIRVPRKDTLESLKAVYFEQADATLAELSVTRYLIKENLLTGLEIRGGFDAGNPELENLNIAVRNDWPELQSILQKAMRSISIQETNKLKNKWISSNSGQAANETMTSAGDSVLESELPTNLSAESGTSWIIVAAILVFAFLLLTALVLPRLYSDEDLARNFGSQRFRAVALIVISLMVVLVALLVGRTLDHNKKMALASIRDDLKVVHQSTLERIEFWMSDHQNFLTQLGRDPKLVEISRRLLEVPAQAKTLSTSLPLAEVREFFKQSERDSDNAGFFIINSDFISIGSERDENLGSKNFIGMQKPGLVARAFAGETMFIPPLHPGSEGDAQDEAVSIASKEPLAMFFAVPIRDADGIVLAVLAQRLRTEGRLTRIMQAGRIGKTSESYLINRDALMVTESRHRKLLIDIGLVKDTVDGKNYIQVRDPGGNILEGFIPPEPYEQLPLTRLAENVINLSQDDTLGSPGSKHSGMVINIGDSYRDYRGVPVFGAWMWIDKLGLGMATEIDVEDSLSGYYSLRFSLFVIASVTLILTISALLVTLVFGERATRTMRSARDELEERVIERTQELQNSEKRTRSIIDNAVDGIIVINDQGVVQSFSPAAESIFGYNAEEIIGKNVNILTPELTAAMHDGYIRQFFATGKATIVGKNREVVGLRKDGSQFPMDLAVGEAVLGNEHIFTGTIRDITERKEADQRLAEKEKQLRAALDNMSSGMLMFDRDGKVILLNDNYLNLFDFHRDLIFVGGDIEPSIRYQASRGDFGEGDIDILVEQAREVLHSRQGLTYESELSTGKIVETVLSPTPDGSTVAIYTDITERKLAELELRETRDLAEEATNAKSEFLASMSHELRTPMNAILGYSEILIEEAEDAEQEGFIPDLKKINQAGTHLLSLINDVLDLSKIESGKMEAFAESFEVDQLIDEVSSTVLPLVEKNGNKLVIQRDDELGEAHQDLTKLRQALYNLMSNAAKFTHEGTITLRVKHNDQAGVECLSMAVSDTGIGISEEKIERVFEAFTQADESTTRNYGGTGLGLAISRRFCQMLGGTLNLESELGKGSTFTITIPANLTETRQNPTEVQGSSANVSSDK